MYGAGGEFLTKRGSYQGSHTLFAGLLNPLGQRSLRTGWLATQRMSTSTQHKLFANTGKPQWTSNIIEVSQLINGILRHLDTGFCVAPCEGDRGTLLTLPPTNLAPEVLLTCPKDPEIKGDHLLGCHD